MMPTSEPAPAAMPPSEPEPAAVLPTAPPPASRQQGTPIALLAAVASALAGVTNAAKTIADFLHLPVIYARIAFIAAFIVAMISWLSNRFSKLSRIATPALLSNVDVRDETSLLARKDDIDRLAELCADFPEVHLIGESGVGKSVMLEWGLRPTLRRRQILLPIRLAELGSDWDLSCRKAILRELWSALDSHEKVAVGLTKQSSFELVEGILKNIQAQLNLTPLFIFDQFDQYITKHRTKLLPTTQRTWIEPNDLIAQNMFWAVVKQWLDRELVHVLFAVRADEADGMAPFRFGSPRVYRLDRIPPGAVMTLLQKLTDNGLVSNPERGWDSLRDEMVEDLGREGSILPIQMKIVIQSLDRLRTLTVSEYNRIRRLSGMEAEFIQSRIVGAASQSRLTEKEVLCELLAMTAPSPLNSEKFQTIPLNTETITSKLNSQFPRSGAASTPEQITTSLEYLADKEVLRRSIDHDSENLYWLLYHDYLCRGVLEAERRSNTWQVRLRDRYRAFELARGRYVEMWSTLLSPAVLIRFLFVRLQGRIVFGPYRSFVTWSTVRLMPYVLALLAVWLCADFGLVFPGANAVRMWTDELNVSVFRRPQSNAEMAAEISSAENKVFANLRKRFTPHHWIRGVEDNSDTIDYWTHAQAMAAAYHVPASVQRDMGDFDQGVNSLFEQDARIIVDTKPYGWMHDSKKRYTRVEPVLWAGSALAGKYQLVSSSQNDLAFREQVEFTANSTSTYNREGGWNIFADQQDPDHHSVYATTLALQMFLDWQDAHLYLKISDDQLRQKIREAAEWLMYRYRAHGTDGWQEGKDGWTPVGLKLQTYAVLLRADRNGDIDLSSDLLQEMKATIVNGSLDTLPVSPTDEQVVRQNINFKMLNGQDQNQETPETFDWYPWAIEFVARFLDRGNVKHLSGRETLRARETLTRLLLKGDAYIQDHAGGFTFFQSEYLYALGSLDAVLRR